MGDQKKVTTTCAFPITLAMCAPAIRMVVIVATVGHDGAIETEVYPVVAIVGRQRWMFSRNGDVTSEEWPMSPDEAVRRGWDCWCEPDDEEFDVVICIPELGPMLASRYFSDSCGCKRLEVACDWPREEDDARLKEYRDEMEQQAREVGETKRPGC